MIGHPVREDAGREARSAGSLRLTRLAGVTVFVHWSWVVGFGVLTWLLASGYLAEVRTDWTDRQRWSVAVLMVLLFLASLLTRELVRALVARRLGYGVTAVSLTILAGLATLGVRPRTARDERRLALSAPATSMALAVVCGAGWLVGRGWQLEPLETIAGYQAAINAGIGALSLLPVLPLDGARLLGSVLRDTGRSPLAAARLVDMVGRATVALLYGAGILALLTGHTGRAVWLVLIGWLLGHWARRHAVVQRLEICLDGKTAGALAETAVPRVTPATSAETFIRTIAWPGEHSAGLVVTEGGTVLGVVSLHRLLRLPAEQWGETTVYREMTSLDQAPSVCAEADALSAVQLLARRRLTALPVLAGREVCGLLTAASVARLLDGSARPPAPSEEQAFPAL